METFWNGSKIDPELIVSAWRSRDQVRGALLRNGGRVLKLHYNREVQRRRISWKMMTGLPEVRREQAAEEDSAWCKMEIRPARMCDGFLAFIWKRNEVHGTWKWFAPKMMERDAKVTNTKSAIDSVRMNKWKKEETDLPYQRHSRDICGFLCHAKRRAQGRYGARGPVQLEKGWRGGDGGRVWKICQMGIKEHKGSLYCWISKNLGGLDRANFNYENL